MIGSGTLIHISNLEKENKKLKERVTTLEKYKEEPYTEAVRLQNCNNRHLRKNIKLMRENRELKEKLASYDKIDTEE